MPGIQLRNCAVSDFGGGACGADQLPPRPVAEWLEGAGYLVADAHRQI